MPRQVSVAKRSLFCHLYVLHKKGFGKDLSAHAGFAIGSSESFFFFFLFQ